MTGALYIKQLYKEGQKFVSWPMRVTYRSSDSEEKTCVLIWAPKSLYKRAVDRNHLRRLMREAYRLHKDEIENGAWQIAFNYIDSRIQPYAMIEKAMVKAIHRILQSGTR